MKLLVVALSARDQALLSKMFARGNHQLRVVNDADSAFALLGEDDYDVVIAPASLSTHPVVEFFSLIARQAPKSIRLLINDTELMEAVSDAHHQLSAPLNSQALVRVLEGTISHHKAITKQVIIKAVNEVKALPSPPKVYMQLNNILREDSSDSERIAQIISQDPALSAKVLQFSNSSALNRGKALYSITDAITKMGVDTLSCIVMTAELFAYEPDIVDFSIEQEQLHSLAVAKLTASLVKPELKQDALMAGLLHDLGKLVLYEIDPVSTQKFIKHKFSSMDNTLLEQKIFAVNHSHVGGYLLHMWSFPYPVIEAVVLHHSPEKLIKKQFGIAQAVYLANALIREYDVPDAFISHYKLTSLMDKLRARADRFRM